MLRKDSTGVIFQLISPKSDIAAVKSVLIATSMTCKKINSLTTNLTNRSGKALDPHSQPMALMHMKALQYIYYKKKDS